MEIDRNLGPHLGLGWANGNSTLLVIRPLDLFYVYFI